MTTFHILENHVLVIDRSLQPLPEALRCFFMTGVYVDGALDVTKPNIPAPSARQQRNYT